MRKKWPIGFLLAVPAAVGALLVGVLAGIDKGADQTNGGEHILIAHGSDRLPSQTATDWVTYADFVVFVAPVKETEVAPDSEEVANGEGLILRDVTLRVDDVVWARSNVGIPAPVTFNWKAFGWQFAGGSLANRVEMTGEDQPRIETGHQYIMAIEWVEAGCTPDGENIPGRWRGLGADAIVPADGGIIGEGEVQGTYQSAEQALGLISLDDPTLSLEDQLLTQNVDTMRAALAGATPGVRKEFEPPLLQPTQCS